jgi:CDP-glucose 4,6-dehydratase
MKSTFDQNFWRGRSVLVTGATGLVGGWLVKELLELGADVIALVRDSTPRGLLARESLFSQIVTVNGSLGDLPGIHRVLGEYSVQTVFHLAAQTIVGVAKNDPVSTLEANVRGTWNILEAARLAKVGQVVVASSDKAYGSSDHLPYRETHPLQGRYPYDCSKSCTDLISAMYAATYGVPVGIARCGNIFGGDDLNFSRMIPDLIRTTLKGERFVIRSDGKFVRDFLFVKDAAGAYLCLAENLDRDRSLAGEAFNFSLELRYTVLDMVHTILEIMGRPDLTPVIQNAASNEIQEQFLACDKAREMLGWKPRFTLQEGLRETIDWYSSFLGIAHPLTVAASR